MICVSVCSTMLSLLTTIISIGFTGSIGMGEIIDLKLRRFTSSTADYKNGEKKQEKNIKWKCF